MRPTHRYGTQAGILAYGEAAPLPIEGMAMTSVTDADLAALDARRASVGLGPIEQDVALDELALAQRGLLECGRGQPSMFRYPRPCMLHRESPPVSRVREIRTHG